MQSGHAEFGQGYHQGPYGYTAQALSSVASNSGHDINKSVATAQQGMYSNAGMPAPAQHHQSMGGPIGSSQPIIHQGQQISRNPIGMTTAAYYPRSSVPRTMQSLARSPLGAVVNQPGQQPSQYGPIPAMVPLQPNFTSFPPTMVNPQFSQMYQQRAYNPPQYNIIANHQNLRNYYTPPSLNSNGYFSSHGMSSYQSMPPQMPPQSIPAQPQPQFPRKVANAIPLIDPKTGKNVLAVYKNSEDSSSRPNSEKESKNSESNICVQFATQVAAVLNDSRSDIASKQLEPVRIDTLCSHETKGKKLQDPPIGELVDENINELQDNENSNEIEFTDSRNLMCNEEIAVPREDIDSNSINKTESGAPKNADSEAKVKDREQVVFEATVESSLLDTKELVKSENLKSTSNVEKMAEYNEIKKINVESVIETDCSSSAQESVKPVVTGVKEELVLPNDYEVLESSSANAKMKVLNEGKKNKTKKKKDLNKRGESSKNENIDAFLDTKEGAAPSSVPIPPHSRKAPTSVSTPVSERNTYPVPIMDSHAIPLPGENPQSDTSPSEPIIETASASINADRSHQYKVTKYFYKEDQWSPLNPEGKKYYDREFLLHLQCQPLSLRKLNNLPKLDVIKDKAHIQNLTDVNGVPTAVLNNSGVRSGSKAKKKKAQQSKSKNVNPKAQKSMEEMKKCLLSLLEKDAELEEVLDWINANVPDTNDPSFARALLTAIYENCLSGSGIKWELNTIKLKSRIPLISRYSSSNQKLQVQTLYAAQALSKQLGQPSGLLHHIFDILYEEDVISDETLIEWEKSDDPYV